MDQRTYSADINSVYAHSGFGHYAQAEAFVDPGAILVHFISTSKVAIRGDGEQVSDENKCATDPEVQAAAAKLLTGESNK